MKKFEFYYPDIGKFEVMLNVYNKNEFTILSVGLQNDLHIPFKELYDESLQEYIIQEINYILNKYY